jgi:hypothetical protein
VITPANVQRGLRVDDILSREISIQWTEAVALVGAACRQMVATGAQGFPAASQVVVYPEGAVVALATSDQHAVRGAAQLLTSLLADDVPVRVRLMLSQATGTDVAYTSVKEFADALAYFERPDPQLVLRALHDRAFAAPSRGSSDSVSSPCVSVTEAAPSLDQPRQAKRTRTWAIGAAATAVVVGLLWFLGPRLGELRALGGVTTGSPSETASTTPTPERVSERAAVTAAPAASALPSRPKLPGSPSRGSNGGGDPQTDLPTLQLGVSNAADAIPMVDGWPRPPFVSPVDASVVGQYAATDREGEVYSRSDPDVVPPQGLYPKLPSDRSGVPADGRMVLDLLISTDGQVEHVRLRTRPRDVHEFMLVSAAKAWRFDPATVHGRPVRFLHSVAITSPD